MGTLMGVRALLEWGWGWGPVSEESGFELGLERWWRRRTKGWTGPENSRFLKPSMPQTSTKDHWSKLEFYSSNNYSSGLVEITHSDGFQPVSAALTWPGPNGWAGNKWWKYSLMMDQYWLGAPQVQVKDTALTALSRKEILTWSLFTVTREVICPPCTGWGEDRAHQCCLSHMGCGGDGGLWGVWFPKENSDGVTRGWKNQCLHEIYRWPLWLPHGNRIIHQLRVLGWHSSSQGWNPTPTIYRLGDHGWVTSPLGLWRSVPI